MLVLEAQNLSNSPGIVHGFFGRQGGVSEEVYASLNCGPGSGDARENVVENRRRVSARLGDARELLTLYQIHSARAVVVDKPWALGEGPQADAMATCIPGVALGILTADCAPVLLADARAGVVGAAHAGWKGAFGGVVEAVVAAMESLGARRERISAAIGPAISQANYEVGPEFRERFASAGSDQARFFAPSVRADHWQFDLTGFVAEKLVSSGIAAVETISACTYAREADFFSFRRATHRGEADYGRDISAILLEA